MTARDRIVVALCVLGASACLAPWGAQRLGLSPHRMHGDLWFGLGGFVVGLAACGSASERARRVVWGAVSVWQCLVVAANWATLWRTSRTAGEVGLAGFFGQAASERMVQFGLVAFAGTALLAVALWPRRATSGEEGSSARVGPRPQ